MIVAGSARAGEGADLLVNIRRWPVSRGSRVLANVFRSALASTGVLAAVFSGAQAIGQKITFSAN